MTSRRSRHIDAILADRRLPDGTIDNPDDIEALAIAIELRAVRPGAGQPDEAFITGLRRSLIEQNGQTLQQPRMTRRTALTAGAGAMAGAAAASIVIETFARSPEPTPSTSLDLPNGQWTAIGAIKDFASEPVRQFVTKSITGFVSLRPDGTPGAVNGICTHQGCLLQLSPTGDRLNCPCHNTVFAPDGTLLSHQLPVAPRPLNQLHTRRNNDTIEVLLPPE